MLLMALTLLACGDKIDDGDTAEQGVQLEAMPAPDDWTLRGPGGPATSFSEDQLLQPCAYLNGDERSAQHHNLVVMHDGYLLFPWAPEYGGGGISFFDVSDPCSPVKVGEAWSDTMRETHTLATGRVGDREYLAVDYHQDDSTGGIGFFDITDPTAPVWVSELALPDYDYPDAYFRVALSTTWVGDRLYVAAGLLGVITVDVSDPLNPAIIAEEVVTGHVVGTFHVIGNVGISSSAGVARVLTYDIGDPDDWKVLWEDDLTDDGGSLETFYFSNVGGQYMLFARKNVGGGPIVYDMTDPSDLEFAGTYESPDGDGGYVFRHGDLLFQGESSFGALYDFSDPANITELGRFELEGDLDTVTPIGNVAVVSVDEKGEEGQATGIFPWDTVPDAEGPTVRLSNPADGDVWVPTTGNIGIALDELIEPRSVHAGSFRVWDQDGAAVPGRFYTLEAVTNFVPDAPLIGDTTYYVEIPAGGIADSSGNPTPGAFRFAFSTGEEVLPWPE